ncbi:hypothetical protein [Kutzneria buriramensis]|uniref:Uncharacterized protein n=1 Tax=Kutzneria buriramensis TaxID=1045776 RepID=A0A3E0HGA7_9PSEU|nr:hypothetical protein [Kutzneria buriramensis]REH44741.1 hypothetical protein BCF44_108221 [Kutzneria buriramensis]
MTVFRKSRVETIRRESAEESDVHTPLREVPRTTRESLIGAVPSGRAELLARFRPDPMEIDHWEVLPVESVLAAPPDPIIAARAA